MSLKISESLTLPMEAVTTKTAILGMTGSGKSYCQTKFAELFLSAGAQVVILDPKGEAYGLRLKADGKTPAFPIPVFGGAHGDVPLRPDMGKYVAELLIDGDYSAILDVSEFISSELAEFGFHFATRLFELKKLKPGAMSLMIDEAQDFIPQNPSEKGMEVKMLGAFERVAKQLRSKGVGMVIAGQRPQEINKKVLNMCELWFAFQMTGVQERDTMDRIFRDKDREEADRLRDLLPKMEVGHAHVWSPRMLKVSDTFEIAEKETLDTSKTPEVGARIVEPRTLSPVDIEGLKTSMEGIIERAKADDPKELRKQIAELQKQLKERPAEPPQVIEVPVVRDEQIERLEARANDIDGLAKDLQQCAADIRNELARVKFQPSPPPPIGFAATDQVRPDMSTVAAQAVRPQTHLHAAPVNDFSNAAKQASTSDFALKGKQQAIIDAIRWWESIGVTPTGNQVGAVALIDPSGGYFSNMVGPLVTGGFVIRSRSGLQLTEAGRALASPLRQTPTLAAYHDMLRERVRGLKSANGKTLAILDFVIIYCGLPVTTQQVGESVGVDHTGGYFSNSIGPLSTMGLIRRERGMVSPTTLLFPEGLR